MNLIVEQLISQPHDAALSIEQQVIEPIETKLGERAAPLGSNSAQTIAPCDRQQVIDWLSDRNFPALPVAPRQDAYKYHKVVKAQVLREVWSHCPLTDNHKPIPVYTGKNPSYLDSNGQPHLVNHRRYQKQLPSQGELKQWFANPANGVGTLGGWNDAVWLDFDVKNFASQQECDDSVDSILAQPELQGTFVGRTHSGGWRVGVSVKPKPDFTNFALDEEGAHVGEALGAGRFTVLHGIGVSGNPYQILNCAALVEVESLRNIGIYPTKANKQQPQLDSLARQKVPETSGSVSASIELEMLGNPTSRAILGGDCPSGDRSGALAMAVQEWYGWELWASENGILVSGSAETLAHIAGEKLGIDSDRVERILKTINPGECKPAALYRGGVTSIP
jgi:hypothetical protein